MELSVQLYKIILWHSEWPECKNILRTCKTLFELRKCNAFWKRKSFKYYSMTYTRTDVPIKSYFQAFYIKYLCLNALPNAEKFARLDLCCISALKLRDLSKLSYFYKIYSDGVDKKVPYLGKFSQILAETSDINLIKQIFNEMPNFIINLNVSYFSKGLGSTSLAFIDSILQLNITLDPTFILIGSIRSSKTEIINVYLPKFLSLTRKHNVQLIISNCIVSNSLDILKKVFVLTSTRFISLHILTCIYRDRMDCLKHILNYKTSEEDAPKYFRRCCSKPEYFKFFEYLYSHITILSDLFKMCTYFAAEYGNAKVLIFLEKVNFNIVLLGAASGNQLMTFQDALNAGANKIREAFLEASHSHSRKIIKYLVSFNTFDFDTKFEAICNVFDSTYLVTSKLVRYIIKSDLSILYTYVDKVLILKRKFRVVECIIKVLESYSVPLEKQGELLNSIYVKTYLIDRRFTEEIVHYCMHTNLLLLKYLNLEEAEKEKERRLQEDREQQENWDQQNQQDILPSIPNLTGSSKIYTLLLERIQNL